RGRRLTHPDDSSVRILRGLGFRWRIDTRLWILDCRLDRRASVDSLLRLRWFTLPLLGLPNRTFRSTPLVGVFLDAVRKVLNRFAASVAAMCNHRRATSQRERARYCRCATGCADRNGSSTSDRGALRHLICGHGNRESVAGNLTSAIVGI